MKVVVLTTSYPTREAPVPGIFVRELVAAVRPFCDAAVVHLERADVRRIQVDRDDDAWRVRYPSRPAAPWHLLAAARGLRLERDYDLVHAHVFLAGFPAVLFQRRPVVVSEHWSVFLPEDPATLGAAARLAARVAFGRAARVLPVSTPLRDAIARLAPHARLEVLPNSVDTSLFHPGPHERDGRRLLTVGLIYEAKGHDVLLRALADLRGGYADVALDVVGDGPLRAESERLARELGIADRVSFHGIRPKEEIASRMRGADLFVLPSRYENNPCSVLESLASGLPVVATSVGGVPELIDDGAGVLVQAGDPAALADGLRQALASLDEFDRAAIAARAAARFGAEHVGARLAAIYREALSEARR